ncbi:MAG TPA: NDP-sugar synthase [Candidatus Nanopelagicales bacterium]|nr:NDP-sugar synthase [Candidatus Nanopelagicales bacterium]
MEAVLLVGGQGTRLRPLTVTTPKPMLPVAGVPCTEHQIARARAAGVTRVVLGTSYKPEIFAEHFGDGSRFGVELVYVTEDVPLGTGGAIRHVADRLQSGPDEPVLVFNGDVLSGHDIAGQVKAWRADAADVTLYLTRVEDPRAYGLVTTDADGRVLEFLEKPQTLEACVTDQVNAGCYVFRRSVIDSIPTGRPVSVERETFPALLAEGAKVTAVVDDGYWLDLGTPLAFVQGSRDLVLGRAPSPALRAPTGQAIVVPGAEVAWDARLTGGTYVGAGATVGSGAVVDGSSLFEGAVVAAGAVVRDSAVGKGAIIGSGAVLDGVVVGDRAVVGPGNELVRGARVWPGVALGDTAVRFSSDR